MENQTLLPHTIPQRRRISAIPWAAPRSCCTCVPGVLPLLRKVVRVVLDNLSTHKPKRDLWLARHPDVHFRYTPTHTSWLNQIEIWFSILSGKSLKGGSFGSVPELTAHIDTFITNYNEEARPFVWTKSVVHQKRMKPCFAI